MSAAEVSHPVFARFFPAMSRAMENGGMADRRASLLAGLAGEVIDIGAGPGRTSATTRRQSTGCSQSSPNRDCARWLRPPRRPGPFPSK